ncbi:hypothetical protein FRC19_011516 [Serendipita sp. 401]|nr:hypothetical protein FRC18_004556 [Serendipita sp. 400]KAG8817178.1 hypothetical protein FRC19_011516 [Serendipita sp. 401]
MMKPLSEAGADINAEGGKWGSALQVAAKRGNAETVQLLIDNGHDLSLSVERYGTALTIAALHGNDDAALALLKSGADPNSKGKGWLII